MRQSAVLRARRQVALVAILGLVSSLFVLGGPVEKAKADHHMPWDQPGSAWQGTIETQIRHTSSGCYYECPITDDEQATYTELRPLDTSANGNYDAHVIASGWREVTDNCYWTGKVEKVQRLDWNLDQEGPNPVSGVEQKIGLVTNDEGQTFFAPWYLTHIPFKATNYCTEDGQPTEEFIPEYNGTSFLGFTDGWSDYASQPLPDIDPDPLRLVGSKTWTLGDPPTPALADCCTEYSFTVTYDLELVVLPPECDTFKTKTRKWSAKTPIRLLPDRHWGDFKVTVDWCYDSADPTYGKITSIRSRGAVDNGPFGSFGFVADQFGFETRWEDAVCEPRCGDISDEEVALASVTRKMAFCFDFSELIDKLGIKGWLKDKVKPGLKGKLQDFIERNGGLSGTAFESDLLAWIDDYIVKARNKIDLIDEKLRDKHVPNFLAEWLENQIEDPFGYIMQRWKDDVAAALYAGEYEGVGADAAADLILGPLFDRVFSILRVCDSGAFLPGLDEEYPGLLVLWQPMVTALVLDDGRLDIERVDLYKHPALRIDRVD